jgi:hypothetical protein
MSNHLPQAKLLLMPIELDLNVEAAVDESPADARRRVLRRIADALDPETMSITRLDASVYNVDCDELLSAEDGRRHDRNDGGR